jgi:hypothetical protein
MRTFVVLPARDEARSLERARADLSAKFQFMKRQHALWVPQEMLGMWVTPRVSLCAALGEFAHSTAIACSIPGRWTMLSIDDATLTRARLLDVLVEGDRVRGPKPRFVPVFPQSTSEAALRDELTQLFARHPSDVREPLLMNPMTGALRRAVVSA